MSGSNSSGNNGNAKHTLIEAGSVFRGNLESTCPIVVQGKLEGEISGPAIEIREGGQISGKVKVTQLSSRGELSGTIDAETIELGGKVQDQSVIRARSLEVKLSPGSDVRFGSLIELSIGEELSKEAVVSEAAAARRPADPPAAKPASERPAPAPAPPPPPAPAPRAAASGEAPASDGVPLPEAPGRKRRNTASASIPIEIEPLPPAK
jgi:cytoskeletal protein CcmA (bactofilin family)